MCEDPSRSDGPDRALMDTTTEALSRYVTALRYEDLSPRAVHAAKRHLIDALGCAMGGYASQPATIARRVAPAWSGAPSARLLGEGRPTTPEAAAFANSVMVRFLDANDTYIARGSGHPSDMLGALLAAAELFTRRFPQELVSEIEVVTRSGQRFTARADYPKGHARNPMTDADVEAKFRDLSTGALGSARMDAALRALWRLENADRIAAVVDLFCTVAR